MSCFLQNNYIHFTPESYSSPSGLRNNEDELYNNDYVTVDPLMMPQGFQEEPEALSLWGVPNYTHEGNSQIGGGVSPDDEDTGYNSMPKMAQKVNIPRRCFPCFDFQKKFLLSL